MHWFGQICTFKKRDLGKWEREVQMCQNQCIFHAPPAHLLPQYCTLLGKTRPRHRHRTGRQLQTADCAPPAHLLPQYCTLLGKTRPRHRPRTGTAGTASSPFRGCVGGEPLLVGHAWRACGFFAGVPLDGTCAGLMGGTFLSCGAAHCPSFL